MFVSQSTWTSDILSKIQLLIEAWSSKETGMNKIISSTLLCEMRWESMKINATRKSRVSSRNANGRSVYVFSFFFFYYPFNVNIRGECICNAPSNISSWWKGTFRRHSSQRIKFQFKGNFFCHYRLYNLEFKLALLCSNLRWLFRANFLIL